MGKKQPGPGHRRLRGETGKVSAMTKAEARRPRPGRRDHDRDLQAEATTQFDHAVLEFQALVEIQDLLPQAVLEDGQPPLVLRVNGRAGCARLRGVHSEPPSSVGRAPGDKSPNFPPGPSLYQCLYCLTIIALCQLMRYNISVECTT